MLNELFIERYRYSVERASDGSLIILPNDDGNYKAASMDDVRRALTKKGFHIGVEVLIGKKWFVVGSKSRGRRRTPFYGFHGKRIK